MTEAPTRLGDPTAGAVRSLAARHATTFGVSLLGVVLLARQLGPEEWGTYGIAFVAQTVGAQIVERGVVSYLIRMRSSPNASVIGAAAVVQAVLGVTAVLAFSGLTYAALTLQAHELAQLFVAVGAVIPCYAMRAIPLGLLERDWQYARVGLIEVADVAVFFSVAGVAVAGGGGLTGVAAATVLRGVASMGLAWMLARPKLNFQSVRAEAPKLVSALPYTGSQVLLYVNAAAAPLLVGGIAGAGEFAFVHLAYTLIVYPHALTAIIARVSFVSFSQQEAVSIQPVVARATARLLRYSGGLTLLLAATSLIWVPEVFGIEWTSISAYMLVVAPGYALSASLSLVVAALNAQREEIYVFVIGCAYTVAYWLLALALVPAVGGLGLPVAQVIATSTVISYIQRFSTTLGALAMRWDLLGFFVATVLMLVSAMLSVFTPNLAWVGCVVLALWVGRGLRPLVIYDWLRSGRITR